MDYARPFGRGVVRDFEDGCRVSDIDADFALVRFRRTKVFEDRKRRRGPARRVDDKVSRQSFRHPGIGFIPNASHGAAIVRWNDLQDARTGANLDVRLLSKTSPADALEQRTRQAERIEAEVTPGEWIKSGPLPDHVSTDPDLDGARFRDVAFDARVQRL